jgi:quinone-modifying oxidoreductase subunit QmoA
MDVRAKPILVIGGGIAGMTAAIEAAEVGYDSILVEKNPYLGGRVTRMYRYFPKMCPPTCGYEINIRRIRQNPRIDVHTLATVEDLTGEAGAFRARIMIKPRYVRENFSVTPELTDQLVSERPDEFNYGMNRSKALYRAHDMAFPPGYVLDRQALSEADAATLTKAAPPGAIDLDMPVREIKVDVGAVIIATGWRPYDATRIENLGYGRFPNVIANVEMERLAAAGGPTGGKILRPSDGQPARNVAFVQCAGSRDENHLPYCSAVCCMSSLKHIRYLREKDEESRATMFYIDIRSVGRFEKFYYDMLDDGNITFTKGKVASISEIEGSRNLVLDVEDTLTREKLHPEADLVVLATGIVPNTDDLKIPFELRFDEYGFLDGSTGVEGIYAAGCVRGPCDVSKTTKSGTAAALRAIQCLYKGGQTDGR